MMSYNIAAIKRSAAQDKTRKQNLPSMPASNHHTHKLRAAQLCEYDAQACLLAALGVREPQPHSPISYSDVNESFAESFGEINTDGGDNPHTHTHTHIFVGQESTGGCDRGDV